MISYLKHDFHICSTVSEKWPHRLSFPRIVLRGLNSRNCILFAIWLSCRSAEVAGSKLNFISVVVLYLMKYHSTGIENKQDSEEKVLIMQICSTSGLHVHSTWQGLRITPRVQVLEYMRGKFPSWTWTLLSLGFVQTVSLICKIVAVSNLSWSRAIHRSVQADFVIPSL